MTTAIKRANLVVLASGDGSNLQAILDACASGYLAAQVVFVICNRRNARAIDRAERMGVPVLYHPLKWHLDTGRTRAEYDADLAEQVAKYSPDLIVLAGWMHILSMAFLGKFPNKVINLHPALPGQFPGTHAIERAYEAFGRGNISETGIMVHFVPDEGVDVGAPIAITKIPMISGESLEALEARMHSAEHDLLIAAIKQLI
jgi:formyltetrahydrofolate-dependent phosphoribosylglycinamide formyltransferase